MSFLESHRRWILILLFGSFVISGQAVAQDEDLGRFIRSHYNKREVRIPMRDGLRLFTVVYSPRDESRTYPILFKRTPYSVGPYGSNTYPDVLGPSEYFTRAGYVFVYQDVRGRYMSEGEFQNVRPYLPNKAGSEIDENSDSFDTIEWLLENVPNHNGRVGMWGISYPGFYAAMGMIDAHPALKAVSPQAPVADWFFDDFHHHGAFFLAHAFGFLTWFGQPRAALTTESATPFSFPTPDGYDFFLRSGTLAQLGERYLNGRIPYWQDLVDHPNYDEYWEKRNLLVHLENVAPAVMVVGGWFDAEDLYGPLQVYRSIEARNPGIFNMLVMGPWRHGAWESTDGDRLGDIDFGSPTSHHYGKEIELPFFEKFLKDDGELTAVEAHLFETGVNRWRRFDQWPPENLAGRSLYLAPSGALEWDSPAREGWVWDEYISDPNRPVPFTQEITSGMTVNYMIEDQRFASRRPDVLTYTTEPLDRNLTLAGPLEAELWVSTSGTDSDWVVKLIDVFPDHAESPYPEVGQRLGGYQMMVRSEVIRGRFRSSYSRPEPFQPGLPTRVVLPLQDILHTFQAGHRIMIQIQSTWFPLVDRNPQTFVPNIFLAEPEDFRRATQRVFRSRDFPSRVKVGVLGP